LMPLLQAVYQRHQTVLTELEVRRLQRQQESELRRQQDEEYQATLAADQERERARTEERESVLAAAAAEQAQQQEAEQALQDAKNLILPEPSTGGTMIRFCLPTGAKINRRFESHQTVGAVKAYLKVYFIENAIDITNVGLSTNFPRQTYHEQSDEDLTLTEAGLSPQAVLMVQDLDA
jgi:FAS-associated factor 2